MYVKGSAHGQVETPSLGGSDTRSLTPIEESGKRNRTGDYELCQSLIFWQPHFFLIYCSRWNFAFNFTWWQLARSYRRPIKNTQLEYFRIIFPVPADQALVFAAEIDGKSGHDRGKAIFANLAIQSERTWQSLLA